MKPVSLADITYEQGLKLIAMRKQAIDSGKIRRMTKEALDNSYMLRDVGTEVFEKAAEGGWMDSIKSTLSGLGDQAQQGLQQVGDYAGQAGDALKQHINAPTRDILTKGLIGAGVGGLGGLGASAMNGDGHWGRNALMGGIAGGAMGGGLGLMQNPEAAEAIQNKFRSMMNTGQQKQQAPAADPGGAAAPAGIDAATPAPAPGGFDAKAEAKRMINIEDPELQMSEVGGTRDTAESYAPEALYGAGAAGTVAGTGYGLRKLHNMKQYHPEALAEMILNNTGKVNPQALERLVADIPEFGAAMGLAPHDRKAKMLDKLLGELRSEGDEGVKRLTGWLAKNKNTGKNILGNARSERFLNNFVPDEKLRSNLFNRGFKRRPGRIGAALGLLGLGGTALNELRKGYGGQVTRRRNAQEVLDQMRAQMQGQQ